MSDVAEDRIRTILSALDPLDPDDIAVVIGVRLERSQDDVERAARDEARKEALNAIDSAGRRGSLDAAVEALGQLIPVGPSTDGGATIDVDEVLHDALIAVTAWDLVPEDHARELYLPFSEWWQQRRPDVASPFL